MHDKYSDDLIEHYSSFKDTKEEKRRSKRLKKQRRKKNIKITELLFLIKNSG